MGGIGRDPDGPGAISSTPHTGHTPFNSMLLSVLNLSDESFFLEVSWFCTFRGGNPSHSEDC